MSRPLVLLWASLGKLANLHEFFTALLAHRLQMPVVFAQSAAIVPPWLELPCGLLLLSNHRKSENAQEIPAMQNAFHFAQTGGC